MVYLFGGEIGWIENFREKIGRKFFLQCVWLGGEKKKINGRVRVFSSRVHQKIFSSKLRENKRENV